MKILVINCGSSSVKYQLFDTGVDLRMARGGIERIGLDDSILTHKPFDRPEAKFPTDTPDHTTAINQIIDVLLSPDYGVMEDRSEVEAVGHRVVHGGERFSNSMLIDDEVLEEIRNCAELAPLHNPHNLKGIEACRQLLPSVPQVAVFDTAFHQTMPDNAYLYAIPYSIYRKHRVRRYGFHGTSHYYLSRRAAEMLDKPFEQIKLVTCHLGNGCSITAVDGGRSVDTSMGFTPLEGLVMGTRSGDIDPAAVFYIMSAENLSVSQTASLLNKESGLLGLSEVSSDVREILDAAGKGVGHADVALRIYCYRVKKYIAAYSGAMGGIDALIFSAGVGENSADVRDLCCEGLEFMGIDIDSEKNSSTIGIEGDISVPSSKVRVLVIPTNEELVIARDTERVVSETIGSLS